jgi:hypothetical protein
MGSNDYYAPVGKSPLRYFLPDARLNPAPNERNLPFAELAQALVGAGWKDLDNRRDAVELAGRRVELVGVDDPHLDLDDFPPPARLPSVLSEPASRMRDAGSDNSLWEAPALRLGVAHAPYMRVLDAMYDDGADLILAGHTHGGQLCVPGFGALVTNCDLDRGRASGLHGWPGARPDTPAGAGSVWLNVCAGLGTSPYTPVRFACRPEAVLLRLVARAD